MSRSKAINLHCKECMYDSHEEGSWRAQVESCKAPECALFDYRPKTVATIAANRKPRINATGGFQKKVENA